MTRLGKLVDRYADGRVRRSEVGRATSKRQRSVLLTFVASFGNRDVKNMSRRDVERWIGERSPRLAPGTRRYEVATLRHFVHWLRAERVLRNDPMLYIKNPTVPRTVSRALDRDEIDRIRRVLPDDRSRAIFVLIYKLGMRRCEVIGAQVGDWNHETQTLIVTGKGGHQRELPVNKTAGDTLDAYLTKAGITAGPMIRTLDGTRGISDSLLYAIVRAWMETSDVKRAPFDGRACHSFRHTAASELVDADPDLRVTQYFLGHISLTSTQRYLRSARLTRVRAGLAAREEQGLLQAS